ncbi:MAG: DUF1501 domain-containing protein [Candidatus Aminicenantes bacterium]|nr:DUF1501 domain-containing protein [Candidatus Aminicenantes bacterium]
MKRREFLRKSCLVSGVSLAAGIRSPAGSIHPRPVSVFIELAGGCDGLNMVVPHGLEDYYRQRPNLAIPPADVLKLDDTVGFHPSLDGFKRLFDAGKVALVQGVGYPDPNRSHFRSRKVWHTARVGTAAGEDSPDRRCLPELGMRVTDGALGANLAVIARCIAAGTGVRLFYTSMGGFDTHAFQVVPGNTIRGIHARLLSMLSAAVTGFLDDLTRRGRDEHVVVVIFSEFGRRLAENETFGTDHGTANPVFIVGKRVFAGLHGRHPGLSPHELTPSGDLVHTVDFRSVFAGVLPGWVGIRAGCAAAPRLSLLRSDSVAFSA